MLPDRAGLTPHAWFDRLAETLLGGAILHAGGRTFYIDEVECYWTAPEHPDPFTHRHELQHSWLRWYFHRVGRGYRGGNYKGLDVTIGGTPAGAFGGVLIRALRDSATGTRVTGPSNSVAALLAATDCAKPSELDERIGERRVDDATSPLRLEAVARGDGIALENWRTGPRHGLSTRPQNRTELHEAYRALPYRYRVTSGGRTK